MDTKFHKITIEDKFSRPFLREIAGKNNNSCKQVLIVNTVDKCEVLVSFFEETAAKLVEIKLPQGFIKIETSNDPEIDRVQEALAQLDIEHKSQSTQTQPTTPPPIKSDKATIIFREDGRQAQ